MGSEPASGTRTKLGRFGDVVMANGPSILGLALLQTWSYTTFFSGILLGYFTTADSLPENYWSFAGLGAACVAVLLLAVRRARPLRARPTVEWLCAVLMFAGVLMIWASFRFFQEEALLYGVGGFVAGCGEAYVLVCWAKALINQPVGKPRLVIVLAFALSFLLYLIILPLPSSVGIAVIALLPFASVGMGLRRSSAEPATNDVGRVAEIRQAGATAGRPSNLRRSTAVWAFVLLFFLWFNFAFFRFIASPWHLATEPWYYFIMFSTAVVSLGVLGVWIVRRRSRKNLWEPRIAVLVLCVSYAVLYVDFESAANGAVAFMITFVCMIGMQMFVWIYVLEIAPRWSSRLIAYVLVYVASTGAGIFAGVQTGFFACHLSGGSIPPTVPMVLLTVLFALTMVVTIPSAGPHPARDGGLGNAPGSEAGPSEIRTAEFVQRYRLSEREAEVLALLLKGRSRPFISQELYLSLGTVNTHVNGIYRKAGVHSVQELITLVTLGGEGLDDAS